MYMWGVAPKVHSQQHCWLPADPHRPAAGLACLPDAFVYQTKQRGCGASVSQGV